MRSKDSATRVTQVHQVKDVDHITKTFDIDSGCSEIITTDSSGLSGFDPKKTMTFEVADGRDVASTGIGSVPGKLPTVHVIPTFASNLLGVMPLYKQDIATVFHPTHGVLIARSADMLIQCQTPLAVGYIQDDTFKVNIKMSTPEDRAKVHHHHQSSVYNVRSLSVEQRASLTMYRLGLASPTRIIDMVNNDLATGLLIPKGLKPTDFDLTNTEASMIAKSKAQPHKDLNMKKSSSAPFELIHVDIEVINIPSYGGSIYSLTIKDDFSNWETKIPLAKKSDLYNAIRKFIAQEVESQG